MSKKALFLDRDGVINIEKNYLFKIEDFEFIDDIFEVCSYFKNKGFDIFVVTNQSGIVRGYYTEDDFLILTSWMKKKFKESGIDIKKVYFCPHHPSISGECECRKPKAGMLLEAKKEFNIDLTKSIIIGDKESDIEAGINASLEKTYLYSSEASTSKATKIISNLRELIC